MDKFVTACDFIVMDMDKSFEVPIILERPFLATAGVMIDVPVGKLSFQLCGKKVDFYFSSPITPQVPIVPPIHATRMVPITHANVSRIQLFDEDGVP